MKRHNDTVLSPPSNGLCQPDNDEDAEVERIMAMNGDEIRAYLRSIGVDPDHAVAVVEAAGAKALGKVN